MNTLEKLLNNLKNTGNRELYLSRQGAPNTINGISEIKVPTGGSTVTIGGLVISNNTTIVDEDNMASDSNTSIPTQQSVKAYVDTQVGGSNELSEILANGNITNGNNIVVSSGDILTANTINETTADNGVVVEGVTLKDSDITFDDSIAARTVNTGSTNGTKIGALGDKLAFFGGTPATQQLPLTAAHAVLTQAGTDTGDTAIQAITDVSPFGFVNAAEGEAVVASVINAMARIQELENIVENLGLAASN